LPSIKKAIKVVGALSLKISDESGYDLGVAYPNEHVHMVSLDDKTYNFHWVELLSASQGGANQHVDERERHKGKPLLSSEGDEVDGSGNEESRITHGG
jgi:hypothetical protein